MNDAPELIRVSPMFYVAHGSLCYFTRDPKDATILETWVRADIARAELEAAVAAETERCAEIVSRRGGYRADVFAAAIRAGKEPKP